LHPKTGLHKVLVEGDVLGVSDVLDLARHPRPIPPTARIVEPCEPLQVYWHEAVEAVARQREAAAAASSQSFGKQAGAALNRTTRDVLRGSGLAPGSRHRLVYSAAANLAECGAPLDLAEQLLLEVARESGLPPRDALRQIRDGHRRGWGGCQ
jgi:hypothetical protein